MKNLLLQLQINGEENFWTEAFAHLLEYLVTHDYKYAKELLLNISNGKFDLCNYDSADIKIRTQHRTSQGIFDIAVTVPGFCVVFENKVEAGLGYSQIENYIDYLKKHYEENYLVILLSKYPMYWKDSEKVVPVRWFDVYQYLEKINQESLSPVSRFLLNQFLEFLKKKGQSVGAKEGLANSIAFIRKQNDLRLSKSFKKLQTNVELKPLHDFWFLALNAIKNIRPSTKVKLGSGKTGRKGSAWIALNFDKADIFCTIYFHEPHLLIFESDRRKIDIEKISSLGTWKIFEDKHGNRKCEIALNLEEVDFFSRAGSKQLEMLEKFFYTCYADLGEQLK